ncbi:MAG: hypothetical protein KKF30_15995 [Proteobacteria bacterium]|nr:hypothetical protein [Pseudomonadota bacterium]MBU4472074.1 hypothetical protein [Pseudomonadota bacterium]MCG2752928.1 hypothetical protein [Desulfobacteraceae bacterium]
MDIDITGIGWVYKTSMGYKDNIRVFDSANTLPPITRQDVLKEPYKAFGRMDDYSKIGVAAMVFAMVDAKLEEDSRKEICMIASTATGCIETDIDFQATITHDKKLPPSPAIFAYTLPSCFLGEVSIMFGLTGESFVINEKNTNGLKGLSFAMDLLHSGQTDTAICGINNAEAKIISGFSDPFRPGALFCVLETRKRTSVYSYGKLTREGLNHPFIYRGRELDSLYDIVRGLQKEK